MQSVRSPTMVRIIQLDPASVYMKSAVGSGLA